MLRARRAVWSLILFAFTSLGLASGLPVDVPRQELFVADQIFRYSIPRNYNFWIAGPHTPHRNALMMTTLWYRDIESGQRIHGAAISDPIYNEDFTQMTVELRDNLYWSDGVQFTADDLIFTVETLIANPGLNAGGWGTELGRFVASVDKLSDFSVQFNLQQPNPRFHTLFETRFNGLFMMPKHVFEAVEDPVTFTFENPVVLGSYIPTQTDPAGFWELYTRRDDWQRTVAGIVTGNPGPRYVLTIFYGDSARKAIAMMRGELDVFFDADFEAFETVLANTPTARSWYTEFPWVYPNEDDSRSLAFNYEAEPLFQIRDVRRALALALDIVELQTEYIGGVVRVTPFPVPPTPALAALFHNPMEEWLQNLQIEIAPGEMFNPYDPTIPYQIAAWAETQGHAVPGTPREVFGTGWWKHAPDVAERLLLKHGFSRDGGGRWLRPDGQLWTITIQSPPDEHDAFRMATAAADQWSDFGINIDLQGLERSVFEQNNLVGAFQISTPWFAFTTVAGDAWLRSRGWHPDLYIPVGEPFNRLGGVNLMRLQSPRIGELIDAMAPLHPESEESLQLVRDFLKYWTENMYAITTMGFKKFVTWDERYWTGFPTAENPTFMPLYWFQGGKFAYQSLTPTNR